MIKDLKHFDMRSLDEDNTYIFIDIDDTLIKYPRDCPNAWFRDMITNKLPEESKRTYKGKFYSYHNLIYLTLVKVFNELIFDYQYQVEPTLFGSLIKHELENYNIIGLTARGDELLRITLTTIKTVGMDFSKHNDDTIPIKFINRGGTRTCYSKGVLYCGGYDKGECVAEFIKSNPYIFDGIAPEKVIVIDDSLSNIESVRKEIHKNFKQIKFEGYHYDTNSN